MVCGASEVGTSACGRRSLGSLFVGVVMPLGYCPACDKLVAIRKGPPRWGSRECDWYPVTHDVPTEESTTPTRCNGDKRAIR